MATEDAHELPDGAENTPAESQEALALGFAMLAGLGLVVMMAVGGVGVIQGADADGEILGVLFAAGAAAMVAGAGAWMGITRPWESFQSVTEGYYDDATDDSHNADDHV
jgi:hypothetical protein